VYEDQLDDGKVYDSVSDYVSCIFSSVLRHFLFELTREVVSLVKLFRVWRVSLMKGNVTCRRNVASWFDSLLCTWQQC